MRSVVSRLLDDERDKIREQAQQAQNDKVALLEKKVERLASSLQNAEGERDRAQRRAQALEASGGLPLRNIMTVGLDQGDPDRERKLALLKEIFRLNKEIREELASKGLLSSAHRDPPEGQEADEPAAGSRAEPETTSEASGAGAEQADESGHEEEATEGIPVLAAGGEADFAFAVLV